MADQNILPPHVSGIYRVVEDRGHVPFVPWIPSAGKDAFAPQRPGNLVHAGSAQVFREHPGDYRELVRFLFQASVLEPVAERRREAHGPFALLRLVQGLRLLAHAHVGPLADLLALELGETLYHVYDEPSQGVRGVQSLGLGYEHLPVFAQDLHHIHEIAAVPVDTVHLDDKKDIPGIHLGHHPLVGWTLDAPPGVSVVLVNACNLPAFDDAVILQHLLLGTDGVSFRSLLLGGDPDVYGGTHDQLSSIGPLTFSYTPSSTMGCCSPRRTIPFHSM